MTDSKENISDIRIVKPSPEHYEAYKKACEKMRAYISDDKIDDVVGKRESRGFIFAQEDFQCANSNEFETKIVGFYEDKRENKGADGKPIQSMNRKACPEYFYFIMKGDEIIGSVNARPQPRDQVDIDNGLKSYSKWDYLSPCGVRITTSTVLLPECRGKGYAGDVKRQFFDELRKQGIEEVAATVELDNTRSNRAQVKLVDGYGGKKYSFSAENPETKEVKSYNRYIVNTDTTGNSKDLYNDVSAKPIKNRLSIAQLRGIEPIAKAPHKAQVAPKENLLRLRIASILKGGGHNM